MRQVVRRRTGWLLLAVVLAVVGCQKADAERLQRVAGKAADKVGSAAGGAQESVTTGLQVMKASVDELSPEGRVAARLRWDKALANSPIRVKADGAAVELSGSVATAELKQRAVALAQMTVGVERVSDALEVSGD